MLPSVFLKGTDSGLRDGIQGNANADSLDEESGDEQLKRAWCDQHML